jgi:hypothetical protein
MLVEIKCPKEKKNSEVGGEVHYNIINKFKDNLMYVNLMNVIILNDFDYMMYQRFLINSIAEYEYRRKTLESQDGLFEYSNLNYTKDELYKWVNNNNNAKY